MPTICLKRATGACLAAATLVLCANAVGATGNAGSPTPHGALPGAPVDVTPLRAMAGVVPWDLLGNVRIVRVKNRLETQFSSDVQALDRREVRIQGYMMPLEPGDQQRHFLLSVNAPTCAYCVPAGPEGVVEVSAKTPVRHTFEPVVLSGRFSVLPNDPSGVYYRMSDAAISLIQSGANR